VDRTTLTRMLGLMEKAGLVARGERESDRRSLAISLTAEGRRLSLRILALTLAETNRALTGFSSEGIRSLRRSAPADGRQSKSVMSKRSKREILSGLRGLALDDGQFIAHRRYRGTNSAVPRPIRRPVFALR
jgi:hypothetical protein